MQMLSLKTLHQDMRNIGVDIQQFRIRTGAAEFDCLFSVRGEPYHFAMTSRGEHPVFLGFPVHNGYKISTYLGDKYSDVLNLLRVDGRSGESFTPTNWFSQIDQQIPTRASSKEPSSNEIARLRPDLEESDKPYFDTWIYHTEKSFTAQNLQKTTHLIGAEAAEYSKKLNASSRWSSTPTERDWRKPK